MLKQHSNNDPKIRIRRPCQNERIISVLCSYQHWAYAGHVKNDPKTRTWQMNESFTSRPCFRINVSSFCQPSLRINDSFICRVRVFRSFFTWPGVSFIKLPTVSKMCVGLHIFRPVLCVRNFPRKGCDFFNRFHHYHEDLIQQYYFSLYWVIIVP